MIFKIVVMLLIILIVFYYIYPYIESNEGFNGTLKRENGLNLVQQNLPQQSIYFERNNFKPIYNDFSAQQYYEKNYKYPVTPLNS